MQNVLLNNPMPNVNIDHMVSPQILYLIKDRKTKDEIIQLTHLTERQLFDDIATLILTGQPVLKTDIAYMSHIDFKALSRLIPNTTIDITAVEQVDEMTTKYFETTSEHMDSGFVRLGLTYYAVRFHLNRLCVPYVDCEQNVLVNAEKLIAEERSETLNTTFSTDRQYTPYRTNRYNGPSLFEFLFGGHSFYDPYEYDDYADDYYGFGGEHYNSDNSDGSISDVEYVELSSEEIVDERSEGSEGDRSEASEEDRSELSEEDRSEASEEEQNEAIAEVNNEDEEEPNEASEDEENETSDQEQNEASEQESHVTSDGETEQDSFIASDDESVINEDETDTEESHIDLSDTDDDNGNDDDDGSDSDFEYESERRNYGRKRRRMNN